MSAEYFERDSSGSLIDNAYQFCVLVCENHLSEVILFGDSDEIIISATLSNHCLITFDLYLTRNVIERDLIHQIINR